MYEFTSRDEVLAMNKVRGCVRGNSRTECVCWWGGVVCVCARVGGAGVNNGLTIMLGLHQQGRSACYRRHACLGGAWGWTQQQQGIGADCIRAETHPQSGSLQQGGIQGLSTGSVVAARRRGPNPKHMFIVCCKAVCLQMPPCQPRCLQGFPLSPCLHACPLMPVLYVGVCPSPHRCCTTWARAQCCCGCCRSSPCLMCAWCGRSAHTTQVGVHPCRPGRACVCPCVECVCGAARGQGGEKQLLDHPQH